MKDATRYGNIKPEPKRPNVHSERDQVLSALYNIWLADVMPFDDYSKDEQESAYRLALEHVHKGVNLSAISESDMQHAVNDLILSNSDFSTHMQDSDTDLDDPTGLFLSALFNFSPLTYLSADFDQDHIGYRLPHNKTLHVGNASLAFWVGKYASGTIITQQAADGAVGMQAAGATILNLTDLSYLGENSSNSTLINLGDVSTDFADGSYNATILSRQDHSDEYGISTGLIVNSNPLSSEYNTLEDFPGGLENHRILVNQDDRMRIQFAQDVTVIDGGVDASGRGRRLLYGGYECRGENATTFIEHVRSVNSLNNGASIDTLLKHDWHAYFSHIKENLEEFK